MSILPLGTILNSGGFDIELAQGTNCSIFYTSLPYSVNCSLTFHFMKGGSSAFNFNVGLFGGVSLDINNNQFVESINYQASIPSPAFVTGLNGVSVTYQNVLIPKSIGSAKFTQNIPQICVDQILQAIPQTSIVGTIVKDTGSDACLGLKYNSTGASNGGASIALVVDMYIIDQTKMSGSVQTLFKLADKVTDIPSFHYQFNIGKLIVTLLRNNGVNIPSALGGRRRRYLAMTDPSNGLVDSNGNFLVGNAATNWNLIIGCSVGGGLFVILIGTIVILRKKGMLKGLNSVKKWAPVKENKKLNTQMTRPGLTKV